MQSSNNRSSSGSSAQPASGAGSRSARQNSRASTSPRTGCAPSDATCSIDRATAASAMRRMSSAENSRFGTRGMVVTGLSQKCSRVEVAKMAMPAPYRNVLGMMRGLLLLRALALTALVVVLPSSSAGQALGVLRVRIVLADADGTPTPAPRYALLISDNPATAEPR